MLKNPDESAETAKRPCELSTPIAFAASVTNSRNGIMIRVKTTVSSNLPSISAYPGKINVTMLGAKTAPTAQIPATNGTISVVSRLENRFASSLPRLESVCENVVTNAADNAPSARRSRKRFGIRYAATNAS